MIHTTCATFICLLLLALNVPAHAGKDGPNFKVDRITSDTGIEAWLVEDHSLPVVTMKFAFAGGLIHDPEDKGGLAKLTSILLDEGAGDIKSQDFQAQLSNNAIYMGFTPARDAFMGSLRTTSAHKQLAFELLALALNKPRFDDEAIARMKDALTAEIKTNKGDPAWLSARTFNGMVFENHYYGQPGGGTIASIGRITRRDLVDFAKTQFAQNLLSIVIVGDMTKEEAHAMIAQVFGTLPAEMPRPQGEMAKPVHDGKTILLPIDTPQTYIAVAQPGISRTDKDWYTAQVMAYILGGGGFDSRLMKEVREKRGLTYGIFSSLLTQDYANVMQTTLSVSNAKTSEALDVIRSEFARMAETKISKQELADAKSYLIGALPLELTTTSDIADVMMSLRLSNLTPDELSVRSDRIKAVSAGDVQNMAKRLLDPAHMTTILVGKPEGINVDIMLDRAPGLGDTDDAQ